MTYPPITVPTHAVPTVDPLPADGQFTDPDGNPIPFIDPTGAFSVTTTDNIVAGKTARVATSAVGIQVGDWVVLTNGSQTDDPHQVVAAGSWGIIVSEPFGITASGTSTLTVSKVTPRQSWDLMGHDFGDLSWDAHTGVLSGKVKTRSNPEPRRLVTTVEVHVGNQNQGAVKQVKTDNPAKRTCKRILQTVDYTTNFSMSGPLQGKDVYVRAYTFFAYDPTCGVRPGTWQLGPRKGPVFHIPS